MRKCYLITVDPHLARLTRLQQITEELGYHVEIRPRLVREEPDEADLVVVDVRQDTRDVIARFGGITVRTRQTRTVVIMNERASSEQRAEMIDAGILSAVPANPTRLPDLLAQVLRDIAEMERPRP